MKALFFLHGFATDRNIWKNQIDRFSQKYRVITPDLNLSNLNAEVQKLSDLCREDDLKEIVIIGWSMGAFLAIKLFFRIPERVKGLILTSATPKFIKDETFPYGLSKAMFRNLQRKLQRNYSAGIQFFYDLMFEGKAPRNGIEGRVPPESCVALQSLKELEKSDVRKLLPKIKVPTLIIHGANDQICLVEAAEYMKNRIPDANLIVFKKGGHLPFINKAPDFNSAVGEFVDASYR